MIRVINGDCREILKTLADNSVHCVVTSPPYFGLRDYGTGTWEGGDPECDHVVGAIRTGLGLEKLGERYAGGGHKAAEPKPLTAKNICPRCSAVRLDRQIGLEPSPAAYIAEMVSVFREVRRVLRDDGTVWLNLGDSYATGTSVSRKATTIYGPEVPASWSSRCQGERMGTPAGYKTKDLLMIPARVAIALQEDGWYLRSDIIWHKPNPMPESVTDRPTSSHEHVFLLTKSPRYFFDAEAVREEGTIPAGTLGAKGSEERASQPGVNSRPPEYKVYSGTRNVRNVWTIATAPFPEAHFATFPPELAERCIKAGTSEKGCCAKCGAPWVRDIERESRPNWHKDGQKHDGTYYRPNIGGGVSNDARARVDRGWSPSCRCDAGTVPCTVLDPFGGAGTVGLVADRLQRDAILIELNPEYAAMARNRVTNDAPMFANVG